MLVVKKIKGFTLRSAHFHEGLTSKDFSDHLGFHIPVFYLSDFPYYKQLSQGVPLSHRQLLERAHAIEEAVSNSYAANNKQFVSTDDDARALADECFAVVRSHSMQFQTHLWDIDRKHFEKVQSSGGSHLNGRTIYNYTTKPCPYVYPEPIENHRLPIPDLYVKTKAIVLLEPMSIQPHIYWAKWARIPPVLVTRFPKSTISQISTGLHELRHICQLSKSPQDATSMDNYYAELDADLFSRHVIAQTTYAAMDCLEAELKARYLDTLATSPRYWFAPALEAIENKHRIPSYESTIWAVSTIRNALVTGESRLETLTRVNGDVVINGWLDWAENNLWSNPEIGFNHLNHLYTKGTFDDAPLSKHIAEGILKAIRYFSPRLIKDRSSNKRAHAQYTFI